jgi:quinol monooxygenase YgiN
MSKPLLSLTLLAMLSSLMVLFSACTVSTPFPKHKIESSVNADEKVTLVLTRIIIDRSQRAEFDHQTRNVIESMPHQTGLIDFSARREIFGDTGWTMSIWVNDDALEKFVSSKVHQEAIKKSTPAITTVEVKRLKMTRQDLPNSWSQVLAILAKADNLRIYEKQSNKTQK